MIKRKIGNKCRYFFEWARSLSSIAPRHVVHSSYSTPHGDLIHADFGKTNPHTKMINVSYQILNVRLL